MHIRGCIADLLFEQASNNWHMGCEAHHLHHNSTLETEEKNNNCRKYMVYLQLTGAFRCKGENMKAMLIRSFNPAEMVEVMKVDKELIEQIKRKDKTLTSVINDEYDIEQTLTYKDGLILYEKSKQKNKHLSANIEMDVFLAEGDVLLKTGEGWQKSVLPIKILTDKEERLIAKYNLLAK